MDSVPQFLKTDHRGAGIGYRPLDVILYAVASAGAGGVGSARPGADCTCCRDGAAGKVAPDCGRGEGWGVGGVVDDRQVRLVVAVEFGFGEVLGVCLFFADHVELGVKWGMNGGRKEDDDEQAYDNSGWDEGGDLVLGVLDLTIGWIGDEDGVLCRWW